MQTLAYTRKLPEDLDRGSEFFDALEHNIQVDDSHDHNGQNSKKIRTDLLEKVSISVDGTGWTEVLVAGPNYGLHKKSVALTGVFAWGSIGFLVLGVGGDLDGKIMDMKIEKGTGNLIDIYSPYSNQAIKVLPL